MENIQQKTIIERTQIYEVIKIMKKITFVAYVLFFLSVMSVSVVSADDNEIFGIVKADVEPNILIIIDNSGSMGTEMEIEGCWEECVDWECSGEWECTGYLWGGKCYHGDWECTGDLVCNEYEENCDTVIKSRMDVAKQTVKDLIDRFAENNRFGIMTFHYSEGGYIPKFDDKYAKCSIKDYFVIDSQGNKKTGSDYQIAIDNYKSFLKNTVDDLYSHGSTPLAETLFEAGKYFAGESSVFNSGDNDYPVGGKYPDKEAIGYRCRKNYIVLLSDGKPQMDHQLHGRSINGHSLEASSDYPSEGSDQYRYFYDFNDPELQDVAGLLFDNDINGNFSENDFKQNITTYTIGFSDGVGEKAKNMLQDAADRGIGADNTPGEDDGGLFFYAAGNQDLAKAFETIMFNIEEKSTSFTSPTVPVHDINNAYSGNYGYMSMFKPKSGENSWIGNLKKYRLNDEQAFASCCANPPCESILNNEEQIKNTASSCWTNINDGGAVEKGGAGQILSETGDNSRKIFANIQTDYLLSNDINSFVCSNDELTPELFNLSTDQQKEDLINKVRKVDFDWKLGDLNHSKPALAKYYNNGEPVKYIFAGSNDGMLHCFNDSDGTEEWAFIPREQLNRLAEVYTGSHSYFIDGSPSVANLNSGEKIVICGERRGGNRYYAIDITDLDAPEYLYTKVTNGQSWKSPQYVTIPIGEETKKESFFITGGYDIRCDDSSACNFNNTKGNYLEFFDPRSGDNILTFDQNDITSMEFPIVSAFAVDLLEDGNDFITHIYAGDMGGNVFALNFNSANGTWIKKDIFTALSSGKKIFEEVDFVTEYIYIWDPQQNSGDGGWKRNIGHNVYFGTGDRANPLKTNATNYFYCIKNDWQTENIHVNSTVSDFITLDNPNISYDDNKKILLDLTANTLQDGTLEQKNIVKNKLSANYNRGWYIELEGDGEKCLSSPLVYNGVVYFTTFTPTVNDNLSDDPCSTSSDMGVSKLYAIDYKTGSAVYADFDGDSSDLDKDDRYVEIKSGNISIAPNPKMIISDTGEKISIGPVTKDVKAKSGVQIFYWKQNFN